MLLDAACPEKVIHAGDSYHFAHTVTNSIRATLLSSGAYAIGFQRVQHALRKRAQMPPLVRRGAYKVILTH